MPRLVIVPVVLAALLPAVRAVAPADAWPAFRGTGDSTTAAKQLPLKWSPTVLPVGGRLTAVVSSGGSVGGFDAKTGEKLWEVGGLKGNTVASPTAAGGLVVVGSSERGSQAGVRLDGRGDADRVAWRSDAATSSFGSPLVYDGLGYAVSREGVVYAFDPATGKAVWDTRLPASCWASPVGGAGRVYFFAQSGACMVVKAGREFEVLAENKLPVKGRVYGVAAVEGALLIRTGTALIRVGK